MGSEPLGNVGFESLLLGPSAQHIIKLTATQQSRAQGLNACRRAAFKGTGGFALEARKEGGGVGFLLPRGLGFLVEPHRTPQKPLMPLPGMRMRPSARTAAE